QGVAKRLDLAFGSFFRRVKAGETPGYPRFKSFHRYGGWDDKEHTKGWKLTLNEGGQHGRLRLHGVGEVKIRGSLPLPGTHETCTILHKASGWYASIVFEYEDGALVRECGTAAVGLDWGVKTFLTGAGSKGGSFTVANPKPLKKAQRKLKRAQRRLSLSERGSRNRRKQVRRVARVHERVANTRKDFLHKTSAMIVKLCALIAVEKLNVQGMTARGGSYKTGLHRAILDTAPGAFHHMLSYKAAEAGASHVVIDTRKVKPTQTCSCCGAQEKKDLFERLHRCERCGFTCDRDVNAARVILSQALFGTPTGLPLPQDMRESTLVERRGRATR
ncbi:MAG: transposase, partial [Alphaproteobacteria bacterium]